MGDATRSNGEPATSSARRATLVPMRGGGWRRVKSGAAGLLDAIGEVLHAMDEGRRQHPVISAHRRQ